MRTRGRILTEACFYGFKESELTLRHAFKKVNLASGNIFECARNCNLSDWFKVERRSRGENGAQ